MTNRKFTVIAGLALAVILCGAAASPGDLPAASPGDLLPGSQTERGQRVYKNLKVLPEDISPKRLQQIMVDEFDDGLGVGCGFCHAKQKGSDRLDYTSDAKPEKEIARTMMRLTLKLNRKYFRVSRPLIGDSALIVTCQTCHRGEAHPSP